LVSEYEALPGFGMNLTFTPVQETGIWPKARLALKMWFKCGTRISFPCCRRAGKISSFPGDLKDLNEFIAQVILGSDTVRSAHLSLR
jgi:hypothetical protein